jgi:phosphoglycerate kinase
MKLRTVDQADVAGKRILVRCGFDVPFGEDGAILDDSRIRECLPTIEYLIANNAKLILFAHNGRPKGKVIKRLSMDAVGERLEQLLGRKITTLHESVGPEVTSAVLALKPQGVILLENLRFHIEEEKNDPAFAKKLADLAEVYVDEAFANIHRDQASMTGVPKFLPSYAGFHLQKEVEMLASAIELPEHPFVAVIGGAKISDKIKVIKKMLQIGDYVLLGGALANTILKAQGVSVGKSLVEDEMISIAKELTLLDNRLRVPVDVVTAKAIQAGVATQKKAVASVNEDEYILDIGPDTVSLYEMILRQAKTIVWGGPMGYFEIESFAKGTKEIARIIGESKAKSIVGGGDTLEALKQSGYKDQISFISTGGGAMLSFLEGATLPALEILKEK